MFGRRKPKSPPRLVSSSDQVKLLALAWKKDLDAYYAALDLLRERIGEVGGDFEMMHLREMFCAETRANSSYARLEQAWSHYQEEKFLG